MSIHYFDGNKFQPCLNIDSIPGLPIEHEVEPLACYISSNNTIKMLLTEPLVETTCLYTPENVSAQMYINTSRGWELVLTEDMEVVQNGLSFKQSFDIVFHKPVTKRVLDKYNIIEQLLNPISKKSDVIITIDTEEP